MGALLTAMDRSLIFTLLLEYYPGFGAMAMAEGSVLIGEATEAWQASDSVDMDQFVRGWIAERGVPDA